MKMNDMFPSSWLKKEDCPVTATIAAVAQEEIKGDNGKELKAVLRFRGDVKPMILNRGNADLLASTWGDDSDAWVGKKIEVYVDPNVMFGGKRVGGIRLRLPQSGGGNGAVLTFTQAIEAVAKIGMSKDQLVARLKAAGMTGYNADAATPLVNQWIEEAAFNEPLPPSDTNGNLEEIPF